jgi:hypothetical protein
MSEADRAEPRTETSCTEPAKPLPDVPPMVTGLAEGNVGRLSELEAKDRGCTEVGVLTDNDNDNEAGW